MLEKMFTTKMSMDKKKLQNRFSKIRSKNGKTSKFIAMAVFAIIIVSIICVSIWVAVNRQDNTAVNSDIKLTLNGELLEFNNEPYVLSESRSTGYTGHAMAFFPLEELSRKLGAECEINLNEAVIKIPGASDNYRITLGKNEVYYESLIGASATRETKFAPEAKNSILYIPYEFIEYIFIDANDYNIWGSTLYKNETMNVQFEIPMQWFGKYVIDETLEDNGYITINHKRIAEKYDGAGILCRVYKELDENLEERLTMLANQTVVWQNQEYAYVVGRPTDVQHPIWDGSDKEDIDLASEYENMAKGITHIESTFSLINDVETPNIANAENMSFAQMKDLQRQVDNGHFPWRLDYEQVVRSFLSGKGVDVEGGEITELAGGGSAGGISLTYSVGEIQYLIELFQPIDKTDSGIWIVKTYKEKESSVFSEEEIQSAKTVVEQYFKAKSERNRSAILSTMTEHFNSPNVIFWQDEKITVNNIDFNMNDQMRKTYVENGRGSVNNTSIDNVIVFKVDYTVNIPEGGKSAYENGDYNDFSIILVRDDKNSQWLIDDMGY